MASISLASVNIEQSKHLDLVERFFAARMPEVVTIQELMESDIDRIAQPLGGAQAIFLPTRKLADGRMMGVGIYSRLPVGESHTSLYRGDPEHLPTLDLTSLEAANATQHRGVLFCDVEKDGQIFRIATTHFTWTPQGSVDDYQRQDMKALLAILGSSGDFVLTGDFNAPRALGGTPGEIFGMIAEKYKDNIPPQYETSLDPGRHRAPVDEQADKMVDYLFTTAAYEASEVILHTGVSDHCAITATISRA